MEKRMQKVTHKQARSRYRRLFWPMMALYVVVVIGGTLLRTNFDAPPLWLDVALALGSALPVSAVLFLMVRYFLEADEFVRLQQLTAFAYGACLTVSSIFVAGFLQMFDVIRGIEVFWFGPAFFFAYGIVHKLMGVKDCG